jgi:type VI secretion system protein VasI
LPAVVACLLAGPLSAGEAELRRGLAGCAATEGDLARLACFDKLAAENGLSASQPVPSRVSDAGKWQVSVDINPVDDTTRVILALTAETGTGQYDRPISMLARCQSNKTELYIN